MSRRFRTETAGCVRVPNTGSEFFLWPTAILECGSTPRVNWSTIQNHTRGLTLPTPDQTGSLDADFMKTSSRRFATQQRLEENEQVFLQMTCCVRVSLRWIWKELCETNLKRVNWFTTMTAQNKEVKNHSGQNEQLEFFSSHPCYKTKLLFVCLCEGAQEGRFQKAKCTCMTSTWGKSP